MTRSGRTLSWPTAPIGWRSAISSSRWHSWGRCAIRPQPLAVRLRPDGVVLVIPYALIFGAVRGIPFWWRLIDCSFGVSVSGCGWCRKWARALNVGTRPLREQLIAHGIPPNISGRNCVLSARTHNRVSTDAVSPDSIHGCPSPFRGRRVHRRADQIAPLACATHPRTSVRFSTGTPLSSTCARGNTVACPSSL